tara:strand:- start:3381 stop:4421 length:1041 start_codon:yes stop_codon:yes gene_type:complete
MFLSFNLVEFFLAGIKHKYFMLKKNILFSIVLAVRNKENYISKTIDSCINQKFDKEKFELIVINDCSSDKTKQKIEKKIFNSSNIKLLNLKKNIGPGLARNVGIKFSKGKYIIFLDGDDSLVPNFLFILKKKLKKKPDLITYNFNKVYSKKKIIYSARKDLSKININNKKNFIKKFLSGEIDGSVIFTCFKRNLLVKNKIKFPKGLHEDIIYIFKSYLKSKNIIKVKKAIYIKNEVKGSITGTLSIGRVKDLLNIHNKLIHFLKINKFYKKDFLDYAHIGFVGYVADTILEVQKTRKLPLKIRKKILKYILNKSINFPNIKDYKYKTNKDFIFRKFIYSNFKQKNL